MQNGGAFASDGKWIYYADEGLCKVKIGNASRQSVVDDSITPESMFYLGDALYYYSFPNYYRLKGRDDAEDLGFSVFTQDCIQYDGKHFYVTGFSNYDESGVYSAKKNDIEDGEFLSDIHPTKLFLNGDHLYVVSDVDFIDDKPNEKHGVWRVNKDGSDLIFLMDECPKYMIFSEEEIYYTNEKYQLCAMNFDGTENRVYEDIYVGDGLNATKGYIFYVDRSTKTIWRMDKDGLFKEELNSFESESIYIVDEWLFYVNEDYDDDIYQMSLDGVYNCPID